MGTTAVVQRKREINMIFTFNLIFVFVPIYPPYIFLNFKFILLFSFFFFLQILVLFSSCS